MSPSKDTNPLSLWPTSCILNPQSSILRLTWPKFDVLKFAWETAYNKGQFIPRKCLWEFGQSNLSNDFVQGRHLELVAWFCLGTFDPSTHLHGWLKLEGQCPVLHEPSWGWKNSSGSIWGLPLQRAGVIGLDRKSSFLVITSRCERGPKKLRRRNYQQPCKTGPIKKG